MDTITKIRIQMAKSGIRTDAELATRCGWSKANLGNRFKRADFKESDLRKIADALNCELSIEFVQKEE